MHLIFKEEQHCMSRDVGEMVTNSSASSSTFLVLLYWLFTGLVFLLQMIGRKEAAQHLQLMEDRGTR